MINKRYNAKGIRYKCYISKKQLRIKIMGNNKNNNNSNPQGSGNRYINEGRELNSQGPVRPAGRGVEKSNQG